jgi:hypothetical protein
LFALTNPSAAPAGQSALDKRTVAYRTSSVNLPLRKILKYQIISQVQKNRAD